MRIDFIKLSFSIIFIFTITFCAAQDPRISQYNELPVIINPANTGNFEGSVRIGALYNSAKNGAFKNAFYGALVNEIYNFSLDHRFGKKKDWGIGTNYMSTNGNNFIMSGLFYGFSLAKNINLNSKKDTLSQAEQLYQNEIFNDVNKLMTKRHNLRIGMNLSYCRGIVDENRGGYSILLDVGGFKYDRKPDAVDNIINTSDYYNMSLGVLYQMNLQDLSFETGFAMNNIIRPNFSIMDDREVRKRIRMSGNMALTYKLNDHNKIKLEHFSWKEGFYFVGPKPETDSADITDVIYGFNWLNHKKLPIMTGIYLRSSKSMFLITGVRINPKITTKLSYELSMNSNYYPVNQFGLSVNYIFADDKTLKYSRLRFF